MSIFNMAKSIFRRFPVKPLDRFEKSEGNRKSIWVVDEILDVPNVPPHARLIRQWTGATEFRTVSIVALADENFYRPLPREEALTPGVTD